MTRLKDEKYFQWNVGDQILYATKPKPRSRPFYENNCYVVSKLFFVGAEYNIIRDYWEIDDAEGWMEVWSSRRVLMR